MISKWIMTTFETWLKQMTTVEQCEQFITLCEKRRLEIIKTKFDAEVGNILTSLKACKRGDTLYLIKPCDLFGREPVTQLTFYKYQPRVQCVWFADPNDNTHVRSFHIRNIKEYQPSRCEAHLRRTA